MTTLANDLVKNGLVALLALSIAASSSPAPTAASALDFAPTTPDLPVTPDVAWIVEHLSQPKSASPPQAPWPNGLRGQRSIVTIHRSDSGQTTKREEKHLQCFVANQKLRFRERSPAPATATPVRVRSGKNADPADRPFTLDAALLARFDFSIEDIEWLDGRPAYRLHFAPNATASKGHSPFDRLAAQMHGCLWVDLAELEWVRLEAQTRDRVKFLGGVVGQIDTLQFRLHRTYVAQGRWLTQESQFTAAGRQWLSRFDIEVVDRLHHRVEATSDNADPTGRLDYSSDEVGSP